MRVAALGDTVRNVNCNYSGESCYVLRFGKYQKTSRLEPLKKLKSPFVGISIFNELQIANWLLSDFFTTFPVPGFPPDFRKRITASGGFYNYFIKRNIEQAAELKGMKRVPAAAK